MNSLLCCFGKPKAPNSRMVKGVAIFSRCFMFCTNTCFKGMSHPSGLPGMRPPHPQQQPHSRRESVSSSSQLSRSSSAMSINQQQVWSPMQIFLLLVIIFFDMAGEQIKKRPILPKSGFFLTSVAGKTKTQAQNSSQKLKKKTQALGGISQKSK